MCNRNYVAVAAIVVHAVPLGHALVRPFCANHV